MTDALAALIKFGPSITKMATDFISTSDAAKRNAQLIDFQNAVIGFQSLIASVQQENATLIQEKRDSEEALKRMENWGAEKKRYKLATPFSGVTVYALQKEMSGGEPAHYLCANCFKQGKQSLIANTTTKEGWIALACSACKFSAQTRWRGIGPAQYAEEITTPK